MLKQGFSCQHWLCFSASNVRALMAWKVQPFPLENPAMSCFTQLQSGSRGISLRLRSVPGVRGSRGLLTIISRLRASKALITQARARCSRDCFTPRTESHWAGSQQQSNSSSQLDPRTWPNRRRNFAENASLHDQKWRSSIGGGMERALLATPGPKRRSGGTSLPESAWGRRQ